MRLPRIPNYVKRYATLIIIGFLTYSATFYSWGWLNKLIPKEGLLSDIVGGVTTSVLIFFFFLLLTPIIEISPKIVKYDDGKYFVKVYNSGFFAIYDVRVSMTMVKRIKANHGKTNVRLKGLKMSFDYLEIVPSMTNVRAHKDGSVFAVLYEIKCDEDIKAILCDQENSTYLRFTISARNGFSGLRKLITENYTYTHSVVEGEFRSGATFKRV